MKKTNLFTSILLLILTCVIHAQPSQGIKDERYIVQVDALDYAFGIPEEIPRGWITFKFKNKGMDTHVAFIGKKSDSLSTEEFKEQVYDKGLWPDSTPVGGPGLHSPGRESETTIYLEPGDYYMACGANTEDGTKHTELGMIRYFKVLDKDAGVSEPVPDGELILSKYRINTDHLEKGGKRTMKVVHNDYPMDIHLVKIEENSSIDAAEDFFMEVKDPTPTIMLGGAEQAEKDRVTYVSMEIEPGEYAWMSQEYSVWGMKDRFKVLDNAEVKDIAEDKKIENIVLIKVTDGKLEMPEEVIPAGRTKFSLEVPEGEEHNLFIERMRENSSVADYHQFFKDIKAFFEEYEKLPKVERDISKIPEAPFLGEYVSFKPQNEKELTVDLVEDKYIVTCWKDAHYKEGEVLIFRAKSEEDDGDSKASEDK